MSSQTRRRSLHQSGILTATLALATLMITFSAVAQGQEPDKPAAPPAVVSIKVAVETTHFTEPLTEDGLINVDAAINRHFRQGVTAERNAAIVLYEVLGASPEGVRLSDQFFKELGVPVPAADGDYFQSFGIWQKGREAEASLEDFNRALENPWKRDELPGIFAWLEASRGHLDRLAQGVQRPAYYSPLIPPAEEDGRQGGLVATLLPGLQMSRALGRALMCRGMLHLGEGRSRDAWQDFLTLHRLGRQVGRGATLIERLVGVALETMALQAEQRWLERAQPSVKQIARIQNQLQSLPPISPMADAVDVTERGMFIDCVLLLSHNRMDLRHLGGGNDAVPAVLQKAAVAMIDWNTVLRNGNQWYDRMAAAMRIEERSARQAALLKLDEELKRAKAEAVSPGKLALAVLPGLASSILTDTYSSVLAALILPAINAAQHAEDRQRQNYDNLQVTLALFAARAASGEFPERLDQLVPEHLKSLPIDRFSGESLKYRRTERGFVLYSFGHNEQDDDGRTFDDPAPADDLVVRIEIPAADDAQ